ncbi:MAG TPA: acyl-CoA dehydrogenase family protein [Acidimicrobiia bacterium]|nr:acyl-CoA dehydrogenase family protein [Acidimicrobiia bacterium]
MHIAYTEEQEELRQELRGYFADLMTDEARDGMQAGDGEYGRVETYKALVKQMGTDGWLGIGWPKEYGGQGRSFIEQLIFTDEASIAGAPVPFLTINTVGPTIMKFGTDEQKQDFLPRILKGDVHFSIGYSEPEAGTDLASLKTRAVRDGDEWLINGQKMWTSLIQYADYVWLGCRTDQDAPKHKGISMIIVPTDVEGFRYTPVRTVADVVTSATYYEDVRVPFGNVVGGEAGVNKGWHLIVNQLNHERVSLCSSAPIMNALSQVRAWAQEAKLADGRRVIDQEWVQRHLAEVHAKVEFLKLLNWKLAWSEDALNPAEASATKVFGTEFSTHAYRLLMEVMGQEAYVKPGSPGAKVKGTVERMYRAALILTFGGGTNEIQRDIIAMLALGMPRMR